MYADFFAKALELQCQGRPFATATVVRVDKPTSGQPGDKAIVTLEGELFGWIGGSCARPTVISEAAEVIRADRARLVRLSSEPDGQEPRNGMTDLSMTCFSGGTMEIYIEPHQPQPQLLIVGDSPIAKALVVLGKAMGYAVTGASIPGVSNVVDGADRSVQSVDGIGELMTPLTYVIVAAHGDHDEMAVQQALEAGAGYVGLVSSPIRATSIREFLGQKGIDKKLLECLHAPAGLDIQARLPEEIALSILAQVVQLRRNTDQVGWANTASAQQVESETAIDPVCGMTVKLSGTEHVYQYEGVSYYFCCGECLTKFSAQPSSHLGANP